VAKVLLSFSGNKLSEDAKWNIFTFYEGLMRALVRNGNDVYYMIANEFVQSYNERSNKIRNTLSQEKLDEYIKNQNFDLIIAFNNALYDGYLQKSNIPYIVWGVDPISVYADKDELKTNKSRYIFAGNCEEDKQNIDKYFEINNAVILRMATDVRAKRRKIENNISFVGSLWNSHEKKLLQTGLDPQILSNIIKLLRKNTNLTPEEICNKLNINLETFKDTSVFWLLHGIATTDRIRVLSGLTDLGLNAYGLSEIWQNIADTNVDLACCYCPELIYDIVATENLYNKSKIGFNMSHIHARESGFSFRLLDIMASNACIVTDDKKIYKELFGKYVTLPTFKYGDAKDARKVCKFLLTHEKEREKIVAGCHKAINAAFRFEHRFKQITDLTGVKLINPRKIGTQHWISAQDFLKPKPKPQQKKFSLIFWRHRKKGA